MVVNGDFTQIDFANGRRARLIDAMGSTEGRGRHQLCAVRTRDVVRHTLVQRIVKAYERYNETIGAGRTAQFEARRTCGGGRPGAPAPRPSRRDCATRLSASMSSPEGSTVTFWRSQIEVRPGAVLRLRASCKRRSRAAVRLDCRHQRGDAQVRHLNREFRGKDFATDVLSFPAGDIQAGVRKTGDKKRSPVLPRAGDIAISLPRARAQAKRLGHSTEQEIRILILHGLLHLLGQDHESDDGRMARAEKRWRARPRPACRPDRTGVAVMLAVILAAAGCRPALGLVTFVQLLYLESMRLRTAICLPSNSSKTRWKTESA